MYDPSVRRRRAVLGLLVAVSLILLTATFGSATGGALGSVQRGFHEVFAPVQEGASQALRPIRDLIGWFGDTFEAKGRVEDLSTENEALRRDATDVQSLRRENDELRAQLQQTSALGVDGMGPVGARVITADPSVWYSRIGISKGASAGISVGDPVLAAGGLVGTVTETTRGTAQVTLITDHTSGVPARIIPRRSPSSQNSIPGIVETAGAGNPNTLVVNYVPPRVGGINEGDVVVTGGTTSRKWPSYYPPNLPIGKITKINDPGSDSQEFFLRPFVNLRSVEFVQVLTQVPAAGDGE